jgi:hypothetical protein
VALFAYGVDSYLNLVPVGTTAASPSAGTSPNAGASGSAAPSAAPGTPASSSGTNLPLIIGLVALVVIVAVGLVLMRRGRAAVGDDE